MPAAGDERSVLTAAHELGIGLVAVTPDQHRHLTAGFLEAAADLGITLRHDLSIETRSAPRLGWRGGDERDFPEWIRRHRRRATFVTSFGAPSIAASNPLTAGPLTADPHTAGSNLTPLNLAAVDPSGCIAHHNPPDVFPSRALWAEATRNYQAMVVRFAIEAMRARRRDPVLGFVHAALLDHDAPVASPGLLGADLQPKEAFRAFEIANRPVVAVADRLPGHLHGGEPLALDLTVVNDSEERVEGEVEALLEWNGDHHRWGARVGVDPDRSVVVATPQFVVPAITGPLSLTLNLHLSDGSPAIVSRYTGEIFADPHEH